jgi:transcriptional regulator of acetoin/glycerol metabolism
MTEKQSNQLSTVGPALVIAHHPEPSLIGQLLFLSRTSPTILGKAEDSTFPDIFNTPGTGRRQAQLEEEEISVTFAALRSRYPAWVNGREGQSQSLRSGDVIQIGQVIAIFRAHPIETGKANFLAGISAGAEQLRREARLSVNREEPLTLLGPEGTEKRYIAEWLHSQSNSDQKFVPFDCASAPRELLEARLFESASAPNAFAPSLVKQAQGGTLFLDHGEFLPEPLRQRLEETRKGENGFRVLFGSKEPIMDGQGHPYATLSVPSLHARKEDIPHWMRKFCHEFGCPSASWDADLAAQLLGYSWPGNVEELRRIVASCCKESGDSVEWRLNQRLSSRLQPIFVDSAHAPALEELSMERLMQTLRAHGGNLARAAADLGVDQEQLVLQMEKWNVDPARFQ